MAALLPWDVLFVGGFVVAGSKAVGRWLKFSQDTSKRYDGEQPRVGSGSTSQGRRHQPAAGWSCPVYHTAVMEALQQPMHLH
jgi:hypothetical protein